MRVSNDGVDASQLGFAFNDTLQLPLNMRFPHAKLDTSKSVSFQNILLTFNTDPPEPTGAGEEKATIVYSFKHGYTYPPTLWSLAQVIQRPTSPGNAYQNYWQAVGALRRNTPFDFAALQIAVDSEYAFFTVRKYYDAGIGGTPNNIVGCQVLVRVYIFVEDYINGS